MWNSHKSILLSRICVVLFMVLLVLILASAPLLTRFFIDFSRADLIGTEMYFIATIYIGSLPVGILLYSLFRMLNRIQRGVVFTSNNVIDLRRISWSCFTGAIIALIAASYYLPWIFIAIAAAFMGLIVRVVKNVVAEAVALKEEVDFTI
ncbi:DUF2975 domain-containing protein [Fusibacter paucivorans]|uniref:DUF2975 domain-containing protein n=1 Tax=Fusibacter paucivorans TaxID=76009 RepID=A0ABS5PR45_9FIRM|nr:DUF2975 domain-containing protein [Fusibacter paucivorans]MBS7527633.1 DUF2975 domain-containing protein [Fusibacter paucivorans]